MSPQIFIFTNKFYKDKMTVYQKRYFPCKFIGLYSFTVILITIKVYKYTHLVGGK